MQRGIAIDFSKAIGFCNSAGAPPAELQKFDQAGNRTMFLSALAYYF